MAFYPNLDIPVDLKASDVRDGLGTPSDPPTEPLDAIVILDDYFAGTPKTYDSQIKENWDTIRNQFPR